MVQLEMRDKTVVNYFASWVSTGWETEWNADWRIEGSKGALILEGDRLYISDKPGHRRKVRLIKWNLSHQAYLLQSFAQALDTHSEPETSGDQNLNSLAATHAAVRAVRERRRVAVSEMFA